MLFPIMIKKHVLCAEWNGINRPGMKKNNKIFLALPRSSQCSAPWRQWNESFSWMSRAAFTAVASVGYHWELCGAALACQGPKEHFLRLTMNRLTCKKYQKIPWSLRKLSRTANVSRLGIAAQMCGATRLQLSARCLRPKPGQLRRNLWSLVRSW